MEPTTIFVYGTLMEPRVRESILQRDVEDVKPAVLKDYKRVGLDIVESLGDRVHGEVFGVDDLDLAKLDRYEGVNSGLYEQIYVVIGKNKHIAYQKCEPSSIIYAPLGASG